MNAEVLDEVLATWSALISANAYVGGPYVSDFEEEWRRFCGVEHAVGVANGTDAIEIALRASGVDAGDEVLVPGNTFVATLEAIVAAGAIPRVVDVDPGTLLASPETLESHLTSRTTALIVVHLFGQLPDMDAITDFAARHGLLLIEDAAQAHGASWRGRPAGSWGHAGTFSFYPGKNLGAFGDGGAIVTNDSTIADVARSIAHHGATQQSRHVHERVGRNSRLDGLQAAVLSAKLRHLQRWNELRRSAHRRYADHLQKIDGVNPTFVMADCLGAHHLEVVRVAQRDRVRDLLAAAGVQTGIHYPTPCHLQEPYRQYAPDPLPVIERAAQEILSLPIYPHLSSDDVDRVSSALQHAVDQTSKRAAVLG